MKVFYIRDLQNSVESDEFDGLEIALKCVLISRNKTKNALFCELQDETGHFQAVVERSKVSEDTWQSAINLRPGNSVSLEGLTTREYKSALASVYKLSEQQVKLSAQQIISSLGSGSAASQAYSARLLKYISSRFEDAKYIEISPRLISSAPPYNEGLQPLRVLYEGYGSPFQIVPSPLPQLIRALVATPYERIFAVSRCFTQGYRDPHVSVESIIVTGVARQSSIIDQLKWVDGSIRDLFVRTETKGPEGIRNWKTCRTVHYDSIEGPASKAVDGPEIQMFTDKSPNTTTSQIGRLCWPPHPEMHTEFSEYIIAEGFSAGGISNTAFSSITVNIDRLLAMLFENADLRRIPALMSQADER